MNHRSPYLPCACAALLLLLTILARADAGKTITLEAAGKPVARYIAAPNPMKPYVAELFTPSGVQILLDSPPDHVHHHGLMFAVGAGATDFWAEKPAEKFGRQVPRPEVTRITSTSLAQTLDWIAPDGKSQLVEKRMIRIHPAAEGGPHFLTWSTQLTPAEGAGPVKLWGSHYFGLGLRLIPDLNGKARFLFPPATPAGRVVRGDERLTPAPWCAAAGLVAGKPVTVAMWDDPRNAPRAEWFTMGTPFAYLSATHNLQNAPMTLRPDETLRLRYGVAIFDGLADADQIGRAYREWLNVMEPLLWDARQIPQKNLKKETPQ